MLTLSGEYIQLRALEPEDIDFLLALENNEDLWHLSYTNKPFSKHLLMRYIENANQDIYQAKQLRLVISDSYKKPLGLIDLYDFDFLNKRAGVGIVIDVNHRRKGYALEALQLVSKYAFYRLELHQLFASINEGNTSSEKLFQMAGFIKTSTKKEWNYINKKFYDEYFYQKINHVY
ncbi:MAG: GNAT family N-acetyltransferase [Flavobacteriaceae bacterium]|nr:GNAT family N-acetyltransferase [Flavobacteriaceae bacterium]